MATKLPYSTSPASWQCSRTWEWLMFGLADSFDYDELLHLPPLHGFLHLRCPCSSFVQFPLPLGLNKKWEFMANGIKQHTPIRTSRASHSVSPYLADMVVPMTPTPPTSLRLLPPAGAAVTLCVVDAVCDILLVSFLKSCLLP